MGGERERERDVASTVLPRMAKEEVGTSFEK